MKSVRLFGNLSTSCSFASLLIIIIILKRHLRFEKSVPTLSLDSSDQWYVLLEYIIIYLKHLVLMVR